jgi:hypothetical protein
MTIPHLPKPPVPLNTLVQGLAVFSIGLGLAELLAPRRLSRGAGMTKNDQLLRGYGLREIATGIGLLLARNPRPWLWGRVAGDLLDAATIALTADTNKPARLGGSFVALLGVGLLDLYTAIQSKPNRRGRTYRDSGRDYSDRTGFPRHPDAMRGAARSRAKPSVRAAAE